MKFTISFENGSGCKYSKKLDFLKSLETFIDEAEDKGATWFDVTVTTDERKSGGYGSVSLIDGHIDFAERQV